jgi:RNA polymerase sigma factor (TIGR02999 family)
MDELTRHDITRLLNAAGTGDRVASEELVPLVYQELRAMAHAQMDGERAGQTLQPTALVHEAYLRLVGSAEVQWEGRAHFFGAAARAMRRILVERARHRGRIKRGGGKQRVELPDEVPAAEPTSTDLLALDEVLDSLEGCDKRKYDVVMLRYFAGLTIDETAAALSVSPATVRNDWTFARAWLLRELKKDRR